MNYYAEGNVENEDAGLEIKKICDYDVRRFTIKTDKAAKEFHFPIGNCTIINTGRIDRINDFQNLSDCIKIVLEEYLTPYFGGTLLVCGIGCDYVMADALGSMVLKRMTIPDAEELVGAGNRLFQNIVAITPGVRANTNIETAQHIAAVAGAIGASCVLVVDAIDTDDCDELCSTIKITDYGLPHVNTQNVGIPVFLIGIPTSLQPEGEAPGENDVTLIALDRALVRGAQILSLSIMHTLYPNIKDPFLYAFSMPPMER